MQLLLLFALAVLVGEPAAAQAMVGYGALTGVSGAAPSAAGKATAKGLERLGGTVGQSARLPATRRVDGAVDLADRLSEAPSIVMSARWGQAGETAADSPASRLAEDPAPGPPAPVAVVATANPASLQRGANIANVIAELGKPTLVISGSGSVGYDRKYVFRPEADVRYSVLVLNDRIVDWSEHSRSR